MVSKDPGGCAGAPDVQACVGLRGGTFAKCGAAWVLALCAMAAGAADYRVGPAPAWAKPVAFALPPPAEATSRGVAYGSRYDVVDDEVRLGDHVSATYHHVVSEAVTEKGVDDLSHHEIEFDPGWETLTLHQVDIVRDGQRVSRLNAMQVKVLQRERDLESRIYDGRKTLNLDLSDVRPGDILEFAYTRSGVNPVLGGHQFGGLDMQWAVPVLHLHRRLSTAATLPVRVTLLNGASAPALTRVDGYDERLWEQNDVPALRREADTPAWFDPFQSVEWTDFATWGEVARWAEPLYRVPAQPGPALGAAIARIAHDQVSPEARVAAVLRLVQQQVRYLGVEIGAGTHTPSAPDVVWARRWGDCKEKALLMVTMLRALGVAAEPVLVNTRREAAIEQDLPTAGAFDHAITRVHVGGADYWLDPTRSPQQGTLRTLTQSTYGAALVLDGQAVELTRMPARTGVERTREVEVDVDSRAGMDKPVIYVVRTTYRGFTADTMRDELGDGERGELQRRYVNFYATSYPGIKVGAPLDVEDDALANVMVVTEHYTIDDFWTRDDKGRRQADLHVPDMSGQLDVPKAPIRVMPMALAAPHILRERMTVHLPDAWPDRDLEKTVTNPAFTFKRTVHGSGKLLTMDYVLDMRADHVDAAQVRRYAADIDSARDELAYNIWSAPEEPAPAASQAADAGPVARALAALAMLLLGIWWLFGRRRQAAAAAVVDEHGGRNPSPPIAPSAPPPVLAVVESAGPS
jgi:transglutaminase-like putative cysteine protease